MEPKFQSSFIPKSPIVPNTASSQIRGTIKGGNLFYFLAKAVFIISVILAVGVFGYKFYLKYRINQMKSDLENAQATLQPEVIQELINLNNRIISTKNLISRHYVLTPLFEFLEISTPKTVRFNDFRYSITKEGLEIFMKGEARGYAALALQSDIFNKSGYFKNTAFSDLNLNERGDVAFSFSAIVDSNLVSYEKKVERINAPITSPAIESATTTLEQTTS